MKKYILFDNDGVLVETETWYYEANKKALKDIGATLELDVYMEMMANGGTPKALEIALENGITKQMFDDTRAKKHQYYQEFLTTKDIAMPNVKKVLNSLSKKYKMGIVTTSRRSNLDLIHKNRGIVDLMDFTLCVEEYAKPKPNPDPYLAGLKKFNAKKEEAIVVEDSQRGLLSAYNAGIECVVVHNEFTKTHDFSKATHFIQKLEELEEYLSTF